MSISLPDKHEFTRGLTAGNVSILARAITLAESTREDHQVFIQEIISACLPVKRNTRRIGITGVPGAGKSTLIESFGLLLADKGNKVAVLAIDPSSSISHGSILGDKTRMESLARHKNVFIRPSPSSGELGGVAAKTREAIVLCELAGYNYVLIETVGVGQSETEVKDMCDFFLLLMLAGAGDELQGIKRGIMEMADGIVFNKADGENVHRTKVTAAEFARAIHFFPPSESGWLPRVLTCSALTQDGINAIDEMINAFFLHTETSGYYLHNRKNQNLHWFRKLLRQGLYDELFKSEAAMNNLREIEELIISGTLTPMLGAKKIISGLI